MTAAAEEPRGAGLRVTGARVALLRPSVSHDRGFLFDEAEVNRWGRCLGRATARSSSAS